MPFNEFQARLAVTQSAQVAKAVIQRADGVFVIIVVHVKSTQNEFYWTYQAKSKRSPRKSWKFLQHFPRDLSPNYHKDFDTFVVHYATTKESKIASRSIARPRELAVLATSKQIPASINPAITTSTLMQIRQRVGEMNAQKAWSKRGFAALDGKNDDLAKQPANEVHVYSDECPVCGLTHSVTHFPNGAIGCYGLSQARTNPALEYQRYHAGRFILTYKNPANLPRP